MVNMKRAIIIIFVISGLIVSINTHNTNEKQNNKDNIEQE